MYSRPFSNRGTEGDATPVKARTVDRWHTRAYTLSFLADNRIPPRAERVLWNFDNGPGSRDRRHARNNEGGANFRETALSSLHLLSPRRITAILDKRAASLDISALNF